MRSRGVESSQVRRIGRAGLATCLGAEVVAGCLGFATTVHLAARLGPSRLATLEVAAGVAGWLLVLVRSGLDQVVTREAARHPRLVAALTDLCLGLRCCWAVLGLGLVAGVAASSGPGLSTAVLAAGLMLLPSALVADVGPRARNEVPLLAGVQVLRAIGLVFIVKSFVNGRGDLLPAALAATLAESLVASAYAIRAKRAGRWPVPRLRIRAAIVLSRRAAVAGMGRFLRVGFYAADAMALAVASGVDLGVYAAGRRLVFALIAVGVVVPSVSAANLSRAWKRGRIEASAEVGRGISILLGLFLPAALGLVLTADRLLPWFFGPEYRGGGFLLVLTAARLPLLLLATWLQTALVAFGHEMAALKILIRVAAFACVVVPLSAGWLGAAGLGGAMLVGEGLLIAAGWMSLGRLGINPAQGVDLKATLVGCLALAAGVALTSRAPLPLTCLAGFASHGACWCLARQVGRPRPTSVGLVLEPTLR